jgi:hypothetical protein
MPWTTQLGRTIEFPIAKAAKIARAPRPSREDALDVIRFAQDLHNETVALNNRVCELQAEVLRLRHENEFMVRLLNDRDQ